MTYRYLVTELAAAPQAHHLSSHTIQEADFAFLFIRKIDIICKKANENILIIIVILMPALTIIGSDLSSSIDICEVVLEVILEVEWCSERLEHCDKL